MAFQIVGSVEDIRELLCGPQQHDEHTKGWRWHDYRRWDEARWECVKAELRQMHASAA